MRKAFYRNRLKPSSVTKKACTVLLTSQFLLISVNAYGAELSGVPVNMDLSSKNQNVVVQSKTSAAINVGGAVQTVIPGQLVTPAQYVAVGQVLASGNQTIQISGQGTATGGTLNLNALVSGQVGNIVIPQNVTAFQNFAGMSQLNIAGNLQNFGTIAGVTTPGGVSSGSIFAMNILNGAGGVISNNLPSALIGSNMRAGSGWTLQAVQDIVNSGTIASNGALNLIAGGSVSNVRAESASVAPSMTAVGNLNIFAGAGHVTNAGLLSSATGNIGINTAADQALNINGTGGTFQALLGNIEIRDSLYKGSLNTNISGGDYLSQNLNIFGGAGSIEGAVEKVTGTLNTCAAMAHISASTQELTLGNNIMLGDPTYYNDTGSITITGTVTAGADADLAIIAAGDIKTTANGKIDTSSGTGSGSNVYLIAGAVITLQSGGSTSPTSDPPFSQTAPAPLKYVGTTTVDFSKSGSGGNVDFSASTNLTVINTSSTSKSKGSGGNVTIVALADSTGTVGGKVSFPAASIIDSSSRAIVPSDGGTAGDITVIATAKPAAATNTIQLGTLFAGGQNKGGNISLLTQAVTAGTVDFDGAGKASGPITATGTNIPNAGIKIDGDLVTAGGGSYGSVKDPTTGIGGSNYEGGAGGKITLSAGGQVQANNLLSYGGGGSGAMITDVYIESGGSNGGPGGNISITADTINIQGDLNSSGGGGGGGGAFDQVNSSAGPGRGGGKGGTIQLLSVGTTTLTGKVYAVDGAGGGFGTLAFGSTPFGGGGGGGSWGGGGGGGAALGDPPIPYGGGGGGGYYNSAKGSGYANAGGGGGGVGTQQGGIGTPNFVYGGDGGGVFGPGGGGASLQALPGDQTGLAGGAGGSGGAGAGAKGGKGATGPGIGGNAGGNATSPGNDTTYASGNGSILILSGGVLTLPNLVWSANTYLLSVSDINVVNAVGSKVLTIASLSDVNISGQLYSSNFAGIFAGGDIKGTGSSSVSTNLSTNSGSVIMVAGASLTLGNDKADVDLSKASAGGGNIDFTATSATTVIDTSSKDGNAGNVTLVALGSGAINGQILFPAQKTSNYSISAGSNASAGTSGELRVFASGNPASAQDTIKLGNVVSGAKFQAGKVLISTASPASGILSADHTNGIKGTSITEGVAVVGPAGIQTGDIVTSGNGGFFHTDGGSAGSITVKSSGAVQVNGNLLAYGGGGGGGADEVDDTPGIGDPIIRNGGNGGNGGSIVVSAKGTVTINGDLNASGGGGGGGAGSGWLYGGDNYDDPINFIPPDFGKGGVGGKGGISGSISVSGSDIVLGGNIYAVSGGAGGDGGASSGDVNGNTTVYGGGGGGGGGAYGGGGGGGAGGAGGVSNRNPGAGGGGGGGYTNTGTDSYLNAGGGGGGGSYGVVNVGGQGGGYYGSGIGGYGEEDTKTGNKLGFGSSGVNGAGGDGGNDPDPLHAPVHTKGPGGASIGLGGGGGGAQDNVGGTAGSAIIEKAGGGVSLISGGSLNVGKTIYSSGIVQAKGNNGGVTVSGNLTAYAAELYAGNGDVGSGGTPLKIQVAEVNANAPQGLVNISNTNIFDTLTVTGSNAAKTSFSLGADAASAGGKMNIHIGSLATITSPSVALIIGANTTGVGSITQQDNLATPTVLASTLFTGATISNSTGKVKLAVTNGFSPLQLSGAMSQGSMEIWNIGSLSVLSINAPLSDVKLNTIPDGFGNGDITLVTGIEANNVNLVSSSKGTGIGGIHQLAPLPQASLVVGNSALLIDNGISTTPAAGDIAVGIDKASGAGNITLTASTFKGDATLSYFGAKGTIIWGSSSAANFTINTSDSVLENNTSQTFTGKLTVVTNAFTNKAAGQVKAGSVDIKAYNSDLLVNNAGLIEATALDGNLDITGLIDKNVNITGNSTNIGTLKVSGGGTAQINVTAPDPSPGKSSNVWFSDFQHLRGPAVITAKGKLQSVQVGTGITPNIIVDGNDLVWLQTTKYVQIGGGKFTGNPLVVGTPNQAGQIVNTSGDVNLSKNITLLGSSFAILASGNINSTGLTSINLSGNSTAGTLFGGNLTLIAGYNFSPAANTGENTPYNTGVFTVTSQSTGGSINLSGVNINLSSVSQDVQSGSLLAVAHNGSISLGTVNTSSPDGRGGNVNIIGQNGVTIGSINTTGAIAGEVNISASDSMTTGTTKINSGMLYSGGFAPLPGTYNNNIALQGNISADGAPVTLNTGASGGISAIPGLTIAASELTMTAGTGGIGSSGASITTSAQKISANSLGNVFLSASNPGVSLLASSGNSFTMSTTAPSGSLTVNGALSADTVNLSSTDNGNIVINAKIGGLSASDAKSVTISANGTGSITDTAQLLPTIATSVLTLSSTKGNFGTLSNPIYTNATQVLATTDSIAVGGGVYIRDISTSAVTINGLKSGNVGSTIDFIGQQASLLTVAGQVTGNNISIQNNGSISVDNKLTASGVLVVDAAGKLSVNNSIQGDLITLSTAPNSGGSIYVDSKLTGTGAGAIVIDSDGNISTSNTLSGTDISLVSSGTSGSISIGGTINATGTVSLSSKGSLSNSSPIGGNSISLTTAASSSGNILVGGPLSSSGAVTIQSDNKIDTTATITGSTVTLTNSGTSGGTTIGGTINASGPLTVTAAGSIAVQSAIKGSTVSLQTAAGTNGNISIGANVTATNSTVGTSGVVLKADGVGTISQSTGVIGTSGSSVFISSSNGDLGSSLANLVVNAPGISLNTNGKVFLISSGTATTLDKSSGSEFQVTALGDLTVGGTTGGLSADFIHLSTLNNGKITVAKAINGLAGAGTNATSVVLSASGTGSISDTANGSPSIAANTLTLSAFSGNIGANGSSLITNADSFAANTKGSVYINNTNTGLVTVGASSGKDFALKAVNVSLGANSTFSGKASFNTSDFTNPLGTIFTAGQLDITNAGLAAGPLSIKNGGTLVANGVGGSINITSAADQDLLVGNNGGATPGTMQINAGATGINLTATGSSASSSNQVVFTGNQNFIGDTTVNANFPPASKQSVTVQTGVTVQGFSKVTVNSNTLNLQGTLIGNPLIFNSPTGFGTIANSQGNVILSNSSSFIFHGQSLAIIAANNIIAQNPILIDLSSNDSNVNGGNGGSLNLLAGFNFTPGTGGQVGPNGVLYQISQSPSTLGGSIQMSNVTIKTNSPYAGGSGGNVLAAAHGGSLNNGSISIGSIDASGDATGGTAGSITIIGNGISVGDMNTSAKNPGTVSLTSATPQILGTIVVQNGNFTAGTVQPDFTTLGGNISVSSINAGAGDINILTGGSGNVSLQASAQLAANNITLTSGSAGGVNLGANSSINATMLNISAGTGGIQQSDDTAITAAASLVLSTSGGDIGSTTQNLIISAPVFSANATGSGNVYLDNIFNGKISIDNSSAGGTFSLVSSSASAFDTVTSLGSTISAPTVNIFSASGNINVTTGTVNNLSLVASNGTVTLGSNTISVVPDAGGNGGSINLIAATIAPPTPTTLTLNANASGNGNGGTINYTSGAGSALTATLILNANAAGTGNGGTVTYKSADTSLLTIGNASGNLQINATGGSVGSASGNGGTAIVSTGKDLTVNPAQLNIGPQGSSGDGAKLTLVAGTGSAASTLFINSTSMSTNGVGNGNGGSISLNAPNISYLNSGTQALSLNANGGGTGNGGSIVYETTNTAALTIGGGANSLNLSASSGATGGNGGSVMVSTGGAMTASPNNLNVKPLGTNGDGGSIFLLAGNKGPGALLITGALSASGKGTGSGGSITLKANSSSDFTIGSPISTNGILGALTVTGKTTNGDISITNTGGGINNNFVGPSPTQSPGLITKVRNLTLVAGAGNISLRNSLGTANVTESIVLTASGNVVENLTTVTVAAKSVQLASNNGTLGTAKQAFLVNALALTASASGLVNIKDTATAGVSLGTSSAGGTFTLTTPSTITTTGVVQSGTASDANNTVTLTSTGLNKSITIGESIIALGGTIKLSASGSGSITDAFANRPDSLQANNLVLKSTTGTIGQIGTSPIPLRVTANNLTPNTSGLINVASNGALTIAGSKTTGAFNVTAEGDLTLTAAVPSAKSVQLQTGNNGNININGNVGNTATSSIGISAGGTGNVVVSTKALLSGKSITLSSSQGNIGTGTTTATAIRVSTPLLGISTGGNGSVNINEISGAATTLANSSSGSTFTLLSAGSLTLNNISSTAATGGGITVVSKGSTLATTGSITSNSGDILINSTNALAKMTLGGTIATSGAAGNGAVTIGIGAQPFPQGAGTASGNVTQNKTGTGTINLGVNGITGPASGSATLTAIDAPLLISTGKGKASQITLLAGTTITADPPVPLASPAIISSAALPSANKQEPAPRTYAVANVSSSNPEKSVAVSQYTVLPAFAEPLKTSSADSRFIEGHVSVESNSNAVSKIDQTSPTLPRQGVSAGNNFANILTNDRFGTAGSTDEVSAGFYGDKQLGIESDSAEHAGLEKLTQAKTDQLRLSEGSMVFAPERNTELLTPWGSVQISAKSVVFVMVSDRGLSVYNFHDTHKGAVSVKADGQEIAVSPCNHVTVSPAHVRSFADINPSALFVYRGMNSVKLSNERVLYSAEFNSPQAISVLKPLKQLKASQNPKAAKLTASMMKTSAIVMLMNHNRGAYQQIQKPALTASAR